MDSHITASIEFYFKGEKFTFSEPINLEAWLHEHQGELEALYDILANKNGLDRYRHEYDVMILEPIQFSQATGLAKQFINHGKFDIEGFQKARDLQTITIQLQKIAKKHLDIDSLDTQPKLKSALLEAYYANKTQKRPPINNVIGLQAPTNR